MRISTALTHVLNTPPRKMLLNGAEPALADLHSFVLANYGHFTSMQARHGGVRGLGLHLARLDQATRDLFGCALPAARVRADLRQALLGWDAASVRVNVYSRALGLRQLETTEPPDLLITVSPPAPSALPALKVRSVRHERYLPGIKHAGTFNLFHQRREARRAGCDDVLFVNQAGLVSEGSIWSAGFWDGARVIWPEAPALPGISMQLLTPQLQRAGIAVETAAIHLADLQDFRCAFFTNAAVAVQPIRQIDDTVYRGDADFYAQLEHCWSRVPWEAV